MDSLIRHLLIAIRRYMYSVCRENGDNQLLKRETFALQLARGDVGIPRITYLSLHNYLDNF